MRKTYIDNIRWMTVVLVVFYHVIYLFNGVQPFGVIGPFHPVQFQDAVLYILYPWIMVLLFLVSGLSARFALTGQTDGAFLRSRTRKLLVPSTIGLLVFQWLQGYLNMRISHAFDTLPDGIPVVIRFLIMAISGIGVLWYIQTLWVLSLALVLVRRLEKGKLAVLCERIPASPILLAALAIPVWAAAQVLNTPVITVYRFGIYGLAFFLGYYLFAQDRVMDALARYSLPLAVIAAGLAVGETAVYFGRNYAAEPVINSPLTVAYLWFACLAILGLMKRYGNRTGPIADYMNRKSWGLYIFHYLPMSACGLVLTEHTALPPVCIYLLTGIGAFAGAILLYEVISRIPVVRWCVLGMRKEKETKHV